MVQTVDSVRASGKEAGSILDVLGDESARQIIKETSDRAMSAKELTQTLNISQPTISRRLRTLTELGLVAEETNIDPDGHHYSMYRTSLEDVTVRIEDGDYEVRIKRRESPSDRISYIWEEMRK